MDPGPADLPTASFTLARIDRARPGIPSLHGNREGAAGGAVVHAVSRAVVPASTRGTLCRRIPRRQPAPPRVRPFRSRGEPIYRESEGPRGCLTQKLDSSAPGFLLKGV